MGDGRDASDDERERVEKGWRAEGGGRSRYLSISPLRALASQKEERPRQAPRLVSLRFQANMPDPLARAKSAQKGPLAVGVDPTSVIHIIHDARDLHPPHSPSLPLQLLILKEVHLAYRCFLIPLDSDVIIHGPRTHSLLSDFHHVYKFDVYCDLHVTLIINQVCAYTCLPATPKNCGTIQNQVPSDSDPLARTLQQRTLYATPN